MEVWILRSSKELKKKKKGGGERGKHRQSVRRNEMLFAVPVNIKYCAVTKEREDSQRGKRSRLRLVGLLLLFSFFPSPSSPPPPPSPFLFLFSFPFSSTFASHYVFVITMMTRGKKLSTLEIRNLSRSWGFPEGKLICSRDERLIYNPWTSRSLVCEECSGRSTRTPGRDKNNFFIFFTAVNKRKREGLSVKEFCSLSYKKFFLYICMYILEHGKSFRDRMHV